MKTFKTTLAKCVTSQTLLGVSGNPPHEKGNCFSILTKNNKTYRIVNFVYENLEHLIKSGLTWPIKICIIRKRTAIIHDERIPHEFYAKRYCEVCCHESVLPVNQIAEIRRKELTGERVNFKDDQYGFVKFDGSKRPTLGLSLPSSISRS
jgi:hypothetical protein